MTARPMTEELKKARRSAEAWRYLNPRIRSPAAQAAITLDDEIERLSASLREMREALEKIVDLDHHNHGPASRSSEIARAALSGIEPDNQQARSASHRSAPASTLSKDTTK
jgi:hypothetical protein